MTVPRPDLRRAQPRQAVVAGGGYIGVEMAGALARRGVAVTVVDQAAQPMTTLDPDMGAAVHRAMEGTGIDVRTGTAVTGSETGSNHKIGSVLTGDGSIPADVVVLGLGVRPDTSLARDAGLPLGDHGGLRANVQMQALGHDHIWAGGDCAEVLNLVWGQYQQVALGTRAGFEYVTVTVRSGTKAGYFPGTQQMTVKITAERRTGPLPGVQIVGYQGSAKRIDTAATALWNQMTVEQMTALDLAYAPPFAPVWDPILVAARQAAGAVRQATPPGDNAPFIPAVLLACHPATVRRWISRESSSTWTPLIINGGHQCPSLLGRSDPVSILRKSARLRIITGRTAISAGSKTA